MSPEEWLDIRTNRSEWARLQKHLRLGDHFRLLAARAMSEHAERMLGVCLGQAAASRGVELRSLDLSTISPETSPVRALLDRLEGARDPVWYFVRGGLSPYPLDELAPYLNQKRDVLRARLPGALILTLHPIDWDVLRSHAPDLWSIHTDALWFCDPPPAGRPTFVDEPLFEGVDDV